MLEVSGGVVVCGELAERAAGGAGSHTVGPLGLAVGPRQRISERVNQVADDQRHQRRIVRAEQSDSVHLSVAGTCIGVCVRLRV